MSGGPPDDQGGAPAPRGARSPAEAALWAAMVSFFIPGAGHLLLKLWSRGAVWLLGWLLLSTTGTHAWPLMALMAIAAADAYFMGRGLSPAAKEPEVVKRRDRD